MKRTALLSLVLVVLAALAGCTLFQPAPPLQVMINAKYGHPVARLGGFPVSLDVEGGTGEYQVDWGDGTIDDIKQPLSAYHIYKPPFDSSYTIVVSSGEAVKHFAIEIPNKPPVIDPPIVDQGWHTMGKPLAWMQTTRLDFRYHEQVVDCPSRRVYAQGVWDPDNDQVTVEVHISINGVENTLFTTDDQLVTGSVPLGVYRWWPGWTEQVVPGYPYYIHPKREPTEEKLTAVIDVTATDQWGATSHKSFEYDVRRLSCQ